MRSILLLLCLLTIFPVHSKDDQSNKIWNFDVYLDDDLIGEHSFIVRNQGEQTYVEIYASFDVKFLFFNAYQYRHSNREIWRDQCLESIESTTDDNGETFQVKGKKSQNTFNLTTNNTPELLEGCIQSFSYWDFNILSQQKLLNSQTGEYEKVEVKNLNQDRITVGNKPLVANHYQLKTAKFSIDLWYSSEGEWLSLRSTTEDGNILNYKLKRRT